MLRSAAVLELYHNAFLIHDDIEDGSLMRRGGPTLHRAYGVPVAVNVGDAMLSLSLQPLLDNMAMLGLGPSLRILEAVSHMTRESVEGQALELDWVRRGAWDLTDADYVRMVEKKTGWYSFITPMAVGAIAARLDAGRSERLSEFARALSVAFQIQDDVLNLRGDELAYGKEIGGDLWEGKRTLILLHAMRAATEGEHAEAARILALPRPAPPEDVSADGAWSTALAELLSEGVFSPEQARLLRARAERPVKTEADVRWLMDLVRRRGSIDFAVDMARRYVGEARCLFEECRAFLLPSSHCDLLETVVEYVQQRVN